MGACFSGRGAGLPPPARIPTPADPDLAAAPAADPAVGALSGTELIALRREVDRLEARWLRGLAGFDRGGEWAAEGAVSTAVWLQVHCRLSRLSPARPGTR